MTSARENFIISINPHKFVRCYHMIVERSHEDEQSEAGEF
ncbi:hypothetical protein HMPREF9163_01870 [Selenomonas sp. oral taxon 138 str. F0429]|nr:hypothetical protein HMPREF9163_01870 [Selenomonas sp. oral taxon 138 str. F0429]